VAGHLRERRVPAGAAPQGRHRGRPGVRARPRHVRPDPGAEAGHPGRAGRRPSGHGRAAGPHRPRRPRQPPLHPAGSPMMSTAPQSPGRTPHKAPQAPLQGPGGEDPPPEATDAPPREAKTPRPMSPEPVAVLISASDTDLLAARASGAPWRLAGPARTAPDEVPGLVAGSFCVIVRLLGGRRSWPGGLAAVLAQGLPTVVLSGEAAPDVDLMAASTVPAGGAAGVLGYLREGGPANLAGLAAFLSDTLLLTGHGFAPPVP